MRPHENRAAQISQLAAAVVASAAAAQKREARSRQPAVGKAADAIENSGVRFATRFEWRPTNGR